MTGDLVIDTFSPGSLFLDNSLNAFVSSRFNWIYILINIKTALAKKGIRQPHVLKNSSETRALVTIKAKFARITPIGAPACAKAP